MLNPKNSMSSFKSEGIKNEGTKKEKSSIFSNVFLCIIAILSLLLIAASIFFCFVRLKPSLMAIGNGNWVIGLFVLPFAIYGLIQIARGIFELCDNYKINSTLNFILTIISCIACLYALSKIF